MGPITNALRVLVVDDDEADRVLLRRSLERSDLAAVVEDADSITSALARIAVGPPLDCVLVDLHLPDGTPESIVRVPARRFAVVIVTGLDRESFTSLAAVAEAEDCVSKNDVDGPTITRVVRAAVAHRKGGG